jgi:hypothetical protein
MNLWQANVRFGLPGTQKTDDDLSSEICSMHNMAPDAVKAVKRLYGNHLAPVRAVITRTRKEYQRITFEGIGGIRLVVVGERQLFLDTMRRAEEAYWPTVREFLDRYDLILEEERISKNGGFKAEDYPTREALASSFKFTYSVAPMPQPNQFLTDALTDDLGSRLAQEYSDRLTNIQRQHTEQTLSQLRDLIASLAETLSSDSPIIDSENRQGIVPKFRQYLDRIPALNITGDPRISQLHQAALESLDFTTEQLRSSRLTRDLAAAKATNILAKFGGIGSRKIAA